MDIGASGWTPYENTHPPKPTYCISKKFTQFIGLPCRASCKSSVGDIVLAGELQCYVKFHSLFIIPRYMEDEMRFVIITRGGHIGIYMHGDTGYMLRLSDVRELKIKHVLDKKTNSISKDITLQFKHGSVRIYLCGPDSYLWCSVLSRTYHGSTLSREYAVVDASVAYSYMSSFTSAKPYITLPDGHLEEQRTVHSESAASVSTLTNSRKKNTHFDKAESAAAHSAHSGKLTRAASFQNIPQTCVDEERQESIGFNKFATINLGKPEKKKKANGLLRLFASKTKAEVPKCNSLATIAEVPTPLVYQQQKAVSSDADLLKTKSEPSFCAMPLGNVAHMRAKLEKKLSFKAPKDTDNRQVPTPFREAVYPDIGFQSRQRSKSESNA